uniref:Uncharacterized protein n=1 Tax=Octopus bimaculoides TaxID=37653 RepID=A0A0L8HUY3_OCTBM
MKHFEQQFSFLYDPMNFLWGSGQAMILAIPPPQKKREIIMLSLSYYSFGIWHCNG